jgi:hypothetical protein
MGGSIKEGVMHGIREPKKNGGLSQQFNTGLVGDERYPKTKGREHHVGFLAPLYWAGQAAMRFGPAAYRGWKASRAFTPWAKDLGKWGRLKDIMKIKAPARLQNPAKGGPFAEIGAAHGAKTAAGEGLGFGIGSFARSNPLTTFGIASSIPQGAYLAGKGIKAAPGGAWNIAKRYADAVIPGDQSHWYTPPEPPKDVPLNPNLKKKKKLSAAAKKEFALEQRENRVNRYLELMGYDRAKKTAIADALIDASKIVSDRGTLDKKNITQELINPIIQATSKRLDKPDQIREAVGLMATKAEIEKDLNKEKDALAKALTLKQIEKADRVLAETGDFEKDIRTLLLNARTAPNKKTLEQYARLTASKYGEEFFKVEDTAEVGVDGIYMIGAKIIRVKDGEPKQIV